MASSQKSAAKQQVKLWIELKEKVDLVYKQLNQYRGACRSVDRLNRAVRRTGGQLDPVRMLAEFVKFERDYRVSRKRLRKLDRQLLAVNLYDKLYDLYESLVMGESIGTGGDLIHSSAIDKAIVVDCNGPVKIEDTSVDDFVCISIDPYTQIDVEMDLMEDVCLEPRRSATLNHLSNKSSADISASTRVTRQQTRRRMVTFVSDSKKVKAEAICSQMPMGINDNQVDDFSSISIDHVPDDCLKIQLEPRQSETLNHSLNKSSTDLSQSSSFQVVTSNSQQFQLYQSDSTSSNLNQRIQLSQPRFECCWEGCDFVTNYYTFLQDHQTVHSDKGLFQCSQCDKSFKTSSDITRHKWTHESEPRFKCSWEGCDYVTNYSQSLKDHQTVHTGERSFQCPQCDKSFKTSSTLRNHKRTHESEPRFKCSWEGCDYGTCYSQALKVHQTVHTGERSFQCSQCDKWFKTPSQLRNHKQTHESEKRFKCSWEGCDFYAHRNDNLKVHQAVHSDERPFQCPQCDKSFKYSTHLRNHKRTHESEKRFKCSWEGCDFRTHHNHKLKVHQTVHTGERPFQCPQCDKTFKTSSDLSSHKRTHESEPRFKCSWEGCDYGSHQLVNLTRHQNRHMKPKLKA